MIYEVQGSIFDSPAVALVNPVNCVGAMGKGLAAEFKRRYPIYFETYRSHCRMGLMRPGRVSASKEGDRYIVSFPTKAHWRRHSQWNWICDGLSHLREILEVMEVPSVAVPALGCGLGGLPWPEVKAQIERTLGDAPFDTYLYGPQD